MAARFSRRELLTRLAPGSCLRDCLAACGGQDAAVREDAARQQRCWEESADLASADLATRPATNLELDLFPADSASGECQAPHPPLPNSAGAATRECLAPNPSLSRTAGAAPPEVPAGQACPPDLPLSAAALRSLQGLAGCDEVGRGPLAGPLVTAAVILPPGAYLPFLRDSKQLSHEERLALVPWIKARALGWAVVEIGMAELNSPTANINALSLEGMRRALLQLGLQPRFTMVDGKYPLPGWEGPQKALIKGDDRCPAIAAASVLAKVHRDLLMIDAATRWPQYGFAEHKGYGTASHLRALREQGPCPLHRTNYAPVRDLLK